MPTFMMILATFGVLAILRLRARRSASGVFTQVSQWQILFGPARRQRQPSSTALFRKRQSLCRCQVKQKSQSRPRGEDQLLLFLKDQSNIQIRSSVCGCRPDSAAIWVLDRPPVGHQTATSCLPGEPVGRPAWYTPPGGSHKLQCGNFVFCCIGGTELEVRNVWWGVIEQWGGGGSKVEAPAFRLWKAKKQKQKKEKLRRPNTRSLAQAMFTMRQNKEQRGTSQVTQWLPSDSRPRHTRRAHPAPQAK